MNFKSLLFLSFLLSTPLIAQQSWQEMMNDENANFYDIQAAFEQAFEGQEYKKGTGWKQFKRWEYYHEQRVDENGNFPTPGHVLDEMFNYHQSHPQLKTYAIGTGNWELLGPIAKPANGTGQPNGNGRLTCIAFHPTDANTIFVGAPSGGFWKSTDGGLSWTQYVAGLTRLGISSIVVHPTTPNTIYIGTGDRDGGDSPGYGVWMSTDGGLTWAPRNTGMGNRTVYEVLMHPSNPNILIASTNGSRIYRTIDGGANWAFTGTSSAMKDIGFKPGDPNTVYASGTTFDVSTNNGASFTQINAGVPTGVQRIALAVSANMPNNVYLIAGDGGGLDGIYRSTNSGTSFTTRTTTPNILGYGTTGGTGSQAWYDLVLAADPSNGDILYAGGVNIWKSVDGGTNWTIVAHWTGGGGADDVHADQHALEFSPHTNNLYAGHDGGIHITTNGGTVWDELSSGLAIAQVYKIGVAQTVDNTVINGYQDNGTSIYYNGNFVTEIGGDGMECIIDPTDENFMYGALYYGDMRRSTNGGGTFSTIADNGTNGINEAGAWVTPYTLDPNNAARMFIGYDNIWRSDDVKTPAANAVVWTRISNFASTSNIRDIAVAPSNSNIVYISKYDNSFRVSNNALAASPTWTNLSANLPVNNEPLDIEIDPTDPQHVFIALNRNIYESTNGGTSWTDISGTLPNINLNTIVIDDDSPIEAMYVGMDVGVYYRDNTMSDWSLYATGLPNIEITELEIYHNANECKSKLMAGTYAQGLWMSDLKDPGNVAPTACFEASTTNACMGQTVLFTSNSSFTPTGWTWVISPATHTYVNATTANSENPEVQFTAAGTYTVSLTAINATGNDIETKTNYITVSAAANASTFNEDFESFGLCATASDCGTTTCPITGKWNNLTNGTDDNIDWRVDQGGTPSTGTGPTVDFNPGTAAGNYAYTEASSCFGTTAILESDCIFLDQDYDFRVGYHMSGADMGSFHIDINTGGLWTTDIIPALSGDQGTTWTTSATVDLSPYTGQSIKLRLRGVTGSGFTSDIAIDDILFTPIVILPTQITDFSAACTGAGSSELKWQVEESDLTEQFEIEKYIPGTSSWIKIGELPVTNSNSYRFEDTNPLLGENLYRIAIVSPSGSRQLSKVVASNCSFEPGSIAVFPNPFESTISLQLHSKHTFQMPYTISNLLGQTIMQNTIDLEQGLNTYQLPLSNLPQGVYLLRIDNLKNTTFRIVKLD